MLRRWFKRERAPTEDDQRRAEALVQVEQRGMMGGRSPELKLTPVIRQPRFRRSRIEKAPLAIEHDE
jgi:hypothetical protein